METQVCSGYSLDDVLSQIDTQTEAGLRPTLALTFCAPDQDASALGAALGERGLSVVGATTAGEIAGGTILEGGCTVMLWEAAPDRFDVWSEERRADDTMEAVAQRLGEAAIQRFAEPVVIVFASGLATDGQTVVQGLERGAGRPVPLYGGLAGDDMRMVETNVLADGQVLSDGLAALILDGSRYRVEGLATSGWQPVGVAKEVTRSEGNVVYELDGAPVLDVYSQYFDLGDLRDSNVSIVMDIGVQYPLLVERDQGRSVIRAPLFSDPDAGSLVFAGGVPQGSRVRFCIPPSLDVVDRVVEEVETLYDRAPDADAVLLVSCKARHSALGPLAEDEVHSLNEVWGVPMAGYFSYGEIGGATGECDFHNETCMLVTVREVA